MTAWDAAIPCLFPTQPISDGLYPALTTVPSAPQLQAAHFYRKSKQLHTTSGHNLLQIFSDRRSLPYCGPGDARNGFYLFLLQILNPSELPALHTYGRARQHWNRARECKKSDIFSLDLTSSRTSWLQPPVTGSCAEGFSINHSDSVPCLNFSVHRSPPTQPSNSWKSRNLWKRPVRKTSHKIRSLPENSLDLRQHPDGYAWQMAASHRDHALAPVSPKYFSYYLVTICHSVQGSANSHCISSS